MIELDFASSFEGYDYLEEKYLEIVNEAFSILNLSFSPIISVSIIDNDYIHQINKTYRGIDRETDVISFALLDDDTYMEYEDDIELGDIFINRNKVLSQAKEYNHSIKREYIFLFVHGLLHLFGYDHMTIEDEKKMFALQRKIVGDLN